MVSSRIEVVTFALWQTLIDENGQFEREVQSSRAGAIAEAAQRNGLYISFDSAMSAYSSTAEALENSWYEGVAIDNRARVQVISNRLGLDLTGEQLSDLRTKLEGSHRREGISVAPQAHEVLAELRARFRLAIVSDTWMTPGGELRKALEQAGLSPYFERMFFSDETGVVKGTGEGFREAMRSLGIAPRSVLHVGDLIESDVAGAQRAGVAHTLLIDRSNHPVQYPVELRSSALPSRTLGSLAEVAHAVHAIAQL